VLLSADGRLFIIDIVNGTSKQVDYEDFSLSLMDSTRIEAAKFDQHYNTLVFRTRGNRFYQILNVKDEHIKMFKPTLLPRIESIEVQTGKSIDFVFLPR